jgi:hypothetical protein
MPMLAEWGTDYPTNEFERLCAATLASELDKALGPNSPSVLNNALLDLTDENAKMVDSAEIDLIVIGQRNFYVIDCKNYRVSYEWTARELMRNGRKRTAPFQRLAHNARVLSGPARNGIAHSCQRQNIEIPRYGLTAVVLPAESMGLQDFSRLSGDYKERVFSPRKLARWIIKHEQDSSRPSSDGNLLKWLRPLLQPGDGSLEGPGCTLGAREGDRGGVCFPGNVHTAKFKRPRPRARVHYYWHPPHPSIPPAVAYAREDSHRRNTEAPEFPDHPCIVRSHSYRLGDGTRGTLATFKQETYSLTELTRAIPSKFEPDIGFTVLRDWLEVIQCMHTKGWRINSFDGLGIFLDAEERWRGTILDWTWAKHESLDDDCRPDLICEGMGSFLRGSDWQNFADALRAAQETQSIGLSESTLKGIAALDEVQDRHETRGLFDSLAPTGSRLPHRDVNSDLQERLAMSNDHIADLLRSISDRQSEQSDETDAQLLICLLPPVDNELYPQWRVNQLMQEHVGTRQQAGPLANGEAVEEALQMAARKDARRAENERKIQDLQAALADTEAANRRLRDQQIASNEWRESAPSSFLKRGEFLMERLEKGKAPFSQWTLDSEVGQGNWGTALLAYPLEAEGTPVVIKIPHAKPNTDEEDLLRVWQRETQVACILARRPDHGVASVRLAPINSEEDCDGYIVYDFVDGKELGLWAKGAKVSLQAILKAVREILDTVDRLTNIGIWYTDLSLTNVRIQTPKTNPRPILIDPAPGMFSLPVASDLKKQDISTLDSKSRSALHVSLIGHLLRSLILDPNPISFGENTLSATAPWYPKAKGSGEQHDQVCYDIIKQQVHDKLFGDPRLSHSEANTTRTTDLLFYSTHRLPDLRNPNDLAGMRTIITSVLEGS